MVGFMLIIRLIPCQREQAYFHNAMTYGKFPWYESNSVKLNNENRVLQYKIMKAVTQSSLSPYRLQQ